VQAFITVMPAASVITLHQKLVGGTVKAIIHHPTDFAGVQWDVLSNFFVLHFTGQKNLTYIYVSIYVSCCSHASLNPWPVLYLIKCKKTCGWCLRVLCGIQLTDTPKVCRQLEVSCKLAGVN
jgi:hypothetical protein